MYALGAESAGMRIHEFLNLPREVQLFHMKAGKYRFEKEQELQNKRFEVLQKSLKKLLKSFQ